VSFLDYEDRDLRREELTARWRQLNRVLYYVSNTFMVVGIVAFIAGALPTLHRGGDAEVAIALVFLAFLVGCLALNVFAHRRDNPPTRQ
jgi:hypothetical protein